MGRISRVLGREYKLGSSRISKQVPRSWQQSELDIYKGSQAYLRYAAGIAIIHSPSSLTELHGRKLETQTEIDEILIHSQTLIWAGLSDVIRYSNKPEYRSPFVNTENHYEEAFPNMLSIVDNVVLNQSDRLSRLNPLLPVVQPLAVTDESIYKFIAHGRKVKVSLERLMDTFIPDPIFGDVSERDFRCVPRITMANREQPIFDS